MRGSASPVMFAAMLAGLGGCVSTSDGALVDVRRDQVMLVDAATVENRALSSYAKQNGQADGALRLMTDGPYFDRMMGIAQRLINETGTYRADAPRWEWQLVLIDNPNINLTCAPGGLMTIFVGLIEHMRLGDDEMAAIVAHELAHALREHEREDVSRKIIGGAAIAAAVIVGKGSHRDLKPLINDLSAQAHSVEQEREADILGLELLARAGYNPKAALSFWKKMELKGKTRQTEGFYAIHTDTSTIRIANLMTAMPIVMPLYESSTYR
jgi:predicted Zn-dependent protease